MTTADWIKGRRELLASATDGPWTATRSAWGRGLEGPEEAMIFVETLGVTWAPNPVDADVIADARSSLPLALDALDAVLTQHRPVSYAATANCGLVLYEVCPTCHDKARVRLHICAECNKTWPCATAEAIETALTGGCRECHQTDGHHKLDCGRRTT